MDKEIRQEYNQFLINLSENLDIPPNKFQKAVERYGAVGRYLEAGQYEGTNGSPEIYVQGSFRLGTVVRPLIDGRESDYDIDLVCQLPVDKCQTSSKRIKHMIGNRLKDNGTYKKMLNFEGKRCWTINYAEEDDIGFHLDVLPSINEDTDTIDAFVNAGVSPHLASQSIAITNKDEDGTYSWSMSNPSGYGGWFDKVMEPIYKEIVVSERQAIFNNNRDIFAKIDDVPRQLVKTPLQKAIQILKRHRDCRFAGHSFEKNKPISMIITTLSARLYNQQPDVLSTLHDIVSQLDIFSNLLNPSSFSRNSVSGPDLIQKNPDGKWRIGNPVNPGENFADRWHEDDNQKAKAFFQWVKWAKNDLVDVIHINKISRIIDTFNDRFDERLVTKAAKGIIFMSSPAIITRESETAPLVDINKPNKPWRIFE